MVEIGRDVEGEVSLEVGGAGKQGRLGGLWR